LRKYTLECLGTDVLFCARMTLPEMLQCIVPTVSLSKALGLGLTKYVNTGSWVLDVQYNPSCLSSHVRLRKQIKFL